MIVTSYATKQKLYDQAKPKGLGWRKRIDAREVSRTIWRNMDETILDTICMLQCFSGGEKIFRGITLWVEKIFLRGVDSTRREDRTTASKVVTDDGSIDMELKLVMIRI